MSDQDFQAQLIPALEQAFQSVVSSTGYAATLVAGSSTCVYTPPPSATPPAVTVPF